MEEAKGIRYNKRALHDIDKIEQYIAQEGFPLTAISYTNRVMEHIRTLKNMPERKMPSANILRLPDGIIIVLSLKRLMLLCIK